MKPLSRNTAPHYNWGNSCDGWRLSDSSKLSVIEERVPAGASEKRHYHEHASQFFYILSGIATIEINGEEFSLSSGEGIEVPPKLLHQFKNESSADVRFLVISTPSTSGDRVEESS